MIDALKPCPFCGSSAKLYHDTSSDYTENWSWSVDCQDEYNCGCAIDYQDTAEIVTNKWNKRDGRNTPNEKRF